MSETARFTDDILSAARAKSEEIISNAENETQKSLQEARMQINREAQDIVANARREAEAVKRRHLSDARHRMKLREQQQKNTILTEVLETTRKRIDETLANVPKYSSLLASLIAKGIRELGSDTVTIHLNASDLKHIDHAKLESDIAKRLEKTAKVTWAKEPIEALGGAIVSSEDGRTRIVNTLDERFEALEPKLLIEAGRLLFSE